MSGLGLRNRVRFKLAAYALGHPAIYYTATRIGLKRRDLVVDRNTDLVLEGFPRCGNSFSTYAFLQAQPGPVRVAHHHHAQAQIIRAAQLGIPACVLIREPEDAVRSLVVRSPREGVLYGLLKYIRFYRDIQPCQDRFVVAPFTEVTTNLGNTIDRINRRFGTTFARFEHTEESEQKVFDHIRHINRTYNAGSQSVISRPTEAKEKLKASVSFVEHQDCLDQAQEIYNQFLERATNA